MRFFGDGFWGRACRRAHEIARPDPGAGLPGTYVSVQMLRGLAVVMVVVFHAGLMARDRFPEIGERLVVLAGAAGVDIFFPISGFVMLVSTLRMLERRDGWRVFAERRIIRIVPLYWLATTAKILAVLAVPGLALHTELDWWHGIASYLFVFALDGRGAAEPVLPVGWTLNYEMFFYAVFAAALFCRKPLIATVSGAMLAAVAVGTFIPPEIVPLTVLNPIILEFVAGMWIAALTLSGIRLPAAAAVALTATALATLVASCALSPDEVERARLLLWGLPGAALLFAAVSLDRNAGGHGWSLARATGDASYSIYLSHGFVLPIVGIVTAKVGMHGQEGAVVAFILSIAASVAAGIVVYRWVELPITQFLLRWRRLRRAAASEPGPQAGAAVIIPKPTAQAE